MTAMGEPYDPDSEDAPERDPNTGDFFEAMAAPPAPKPVAVEEASAAYTVIARKYRPRTF